MNAAIAKSLWPACRSGLELDRFLTGESGESESAQLLAHVEQCVSCTAQLAALRAVQAESLPPLRLLGAPPAPIAPGEQAEAGRIDSAPLPLQRVSDKRERRGRWARRAFAAAAFAAAASMFLVLRADQRASSERLKGSGPSLQMYVQHGGEVRLAAPGEVVAPGDAIRFTVGLKAPAYVAVLSLDPAGRASVYFPIAERAAQVPAGTEVALPLGTMLDATVGEERVFGLFCSSAVELEPLRARLQGEGLSPPEGCQVTRWSFVKR
jgi:Domain of unknown function (DUF4384)